MASATPFRTHDGSLFLLSDHLGKAPLSITLGCGEITITHYLTGQMPSEEYSNIIKKRYPSYVISFYANAAKLGETTLYTSLLWIYLLPTLLSYYECLCHFAYPRRIYLTNQKI